jgi:hypothetical protein
MGAIRRWTSSRPGTNHYSKRFLARFVMLLLASLLLLSSAVHADLAEMPDIGLAPDPAPTEVTGEMRPGSHVKLFLPNLPYLAISHAINASLVRPADNEQGWQYDLATSHQPPEYRR